MRAGAAMHKFTGTCLPLQLALLTADQLCGCSYGFPGFGFGGFGGYGFGYPYGGVLLQSVSANLL